MEFKLTCLCNKCLQLCSILLPLSHPLPSPHPLPSLPPPLDNNSNLSLNFESKIYLICRSVSKWVIFRFFFVDSSAHRSWDNTLSFSPPFFFFFFYIHTAQVAAYGEDSGGWGRVSQSNAHLVNQPSSHPSSWAVSQSSSNLKPVHQPVDWSIGRPSSHSVVLCVSITHESVSRSFSELFSPNISYLFNYFSKSFIQSSSYSNGAPVELIM